MKKKLLGLIVAFAIVALAVGMSVAFPIYASAETGDITYLAPVYDAQGNVTFDNNGEVVMQTKTISEEAYTVVTKQTKVLGKNDSAAAPDENGEYWYVVNSTVASDNNGLTITGKVNLILCDGASASYRFDTISVTEGNELTIYGQENGTGILNCNTSNSSGAVGAGIGGDDVNPNAGKITINGGTVSARGLTNSGAGIGGGNGGNGGEITINGGMVTATGGTYYGAGIGGAGGGDSGTIVINGGTITVKAGRKSAAIGASSTDTVNGAASLIKINGGTINATGVTDAAAIGGCYKGTLEGIEIRGGTLNITSGAVSLGVGTFVKQAATNPYVNIYGGIVIAERIGCSNSTSGYTKVDINIHGGEVRTSNSIGSTKGDSGQITITGGKVIAFANGNVIRGGAAIGGGAIDDNSGGIGYVTITGGYIEAYGGGSSYGGAGIGGAYKGHGVVNISGGCIIAEGGPGADGIGSGSATDPKGVHLTFSGGVGINPDEDTPTTPSEPNMPSINGSQTASTGAIVFTTGITNFSADAETNYTGIICFKYGGTEVYSPSEFVFTENLTIPAEYTLELKEHGKITFTNGATLTVNGTFINNGTLTLAKGATLNGEGEIFATQSGKSFEGWYEDNDLSVAFVSFGTPVSKNTTLYPKLSDGEDSVELDVQGITTVVSTQFLLTGSSTYSGTPRAYLNNAFIKDVDFKVSYYALTVDENGEVLSRKEITKSEVLYIGVYETVIEVVDNTNDGINYYGSRSFRTEIIQRELKVTTRNQIIRADGSVSNLLYTITSVESYLPDASISLTLAVSENNEIVFTDYKVLDSNGKDITWNCNFVQNRNGVVATLPESSDEYTVSASYDNINVPKEGETVQSYSYLKVKIGSTTYYIVPDTVEFLNEGLQGITFEDGWICTTPEASRNTRETTSGTNNKIVVNATASAVFGEVTISATDKYNLLWAPSAPTSVVIYKDGVKITEDSLNVSSGITATYTAKVFDQYGYEVTDQTIAWSVSAGEGISIENGILTVTSSEENRNITITATSGSIKFEFPVKLMGECEHIWDEGVITTNPTCSAVGVKTYTCTHNNEHTKTEDVAIDENAHTDGDNNGKCDACDKAMTTATPDFDVDHESGEDPGTNDTNAGNNDNDGLDSGTIVAIAAGSTAVGSTGIFALVWFVIKKKTWADFLAIFKK